MACGRKSHKSWLAARSCWSGAVLFVFAIPYFHMVDTGGSGTVCRRILPAYDPHDPLALEAAVLAGDGEWKRCNERYHGRDDPHYDSAIVRFNDLLNPPHPAIARIQANLNHSKDTRSGNINKASPPE